MRLLDEIARGERAMLALLAILTVTKGLVWMSAFPPFKIADEPSHFENVQFRAEHGRAPAFDPTAKPEGKVIHEGAAPEVKLLWNRTNAYFRGDYLRGAPTVPDEATLEGLAKIPEGREGDGQISSMAYPGFYYAAGVLPYLLFSTSSVVTRIFAVRCLSLFFGLVAVLATYLAARQVFDDRSLAFAAAVLVAMQPMESQMTVAVNNDAAVIGLSAVIFYLQLRFLARAPELPRTSAALLLATLAGLNILAKPTGYAMVPGCLVVLAALLGPQLRSRRAWWLAGGATLAFALVGGIYTIIQYRAGHLIPGLSTPHAPQAPTSFLSFLDRLDTDYADYLLKSAWGQFGWLDYSLPGEWLDRLYRVGALAKLGFLVLMVTRLLWPPNARFWIATGTLAFTVGTALFSVLFILFAEYRFRVVGFFGVIQGRNFLFALPAFAILVTACLGSLVPARYRPVTAAAIATGAIALNLAGLTTVLNFNYSG